ncbi:MAG: isochorismatase family protein [Planctomycetes bacterium]|nr:isochorismatase family protein [Planctomycetota bacterium]
MNHATQLIAAESALLIIDAQEKLVPLIHGSEAMVRNLAFLIDGAAILDIPVFASEQYPKGLGPTITALAKKLPVRAAKVAFSCCAIPSIIEDFRKLNRTRIVLAGIESHVCVLNTALDLLAEDFWVYLAVDAMGSRYGIDHDITVRRLEGAGAILTTVETAVFEWTAASSHPRFKQVSALVQARMRALRG